MTVGELMSKDVGTCTPAETLNEAARLMWERDCGCVPVTGGNGSNRVVGIITDRDICMASYIQGKRLQDLRVGDVMSTMVRTCRPDDSLADAEKTMRDAQIRRIPVVDAAGGLLGLLSLADLVRKARREKGARRQQITKEEVCDTLAEIAAPRPRALVQQAAEEGVGARCNTAQLAWFAMLRASP